MRRPPPSLLPIHIAADLTGLTADQIMEQVNAGTVRTDKIGPKRTLYVCLQDIEVLGEGRGEQ